MRSTLRIGVYIFIIFFSLLTLAEELKSQSNNQDLKDIVRLSFSKAESSITEPVKDSIIHAIEIKINSEAKINEPLEVLVEVQKSSSANQTDYKLLEENIVLTNKIRSGVIILQINSDTIVEPDETIILKISKSEKFLLDEPKEYKLTIKNDLNLPDPASLYIGYNFDFLDGVRANNLYYHLNLNFLSLSDFGELNRIGLESGISQNRTIATDSTGLDSFFSFGPVADEEQRDSLFIRYENKIVKTQIDYLSIYFSPSFRLNRKLTTNNFYVGLYSEILQKKFIYEYKRDETTAFIRPKPPEYNIYYVRPNPIKSTITLINWGPSIQYYHISDNIKFHIRGIWGKSYTNDNDKLGFGTPKTGEFYIVNFDITERKNLISLGGEIRGDDLGSPDPLDLKSPNISIYIAKKFSLQKLADFITK